MNLYDANGNAISVNSGTVVETVEPAVDDVPRVFLEGEMPTSKTTVNLHMHYRSKTKAFDCPITLKWQGNSSLNYPKKNFTIKLFQDEACTAKYKVDFRGWGKQNKFVLKANWVDILHFHNVCGARLWSQVVASRETYEDLPEGLRTSPNNGAVDGFPVLVYANGTYLGRYTLNIPKDAWTYNMEDDLDNHCILMGESNVADECKFRTLLTAIDGTYWTDELHDNCPTSILNRWNEVIGFVMNSTDVDFKNNLSNYIDVASLIDYFLLMYVGHGTDSMARNIMFLTYDGVKWYANAYDMDALFGLNSSGTILANASTASFPENSYAWLQGDNDNLLFERLIALFSDEIKARYAVLRNGVLSESNIINTVESFTDVVPMSIVEEDYAETTANGEYTAIPSKDTNTIQYFRKFVVERLAYMDNLLL